MSASDHPPVRRLPSRSCRPARGSRSKPSRSSERAAGARQSGGQNGAVNPRESADPGDRHRERKVDGLERLLFENARLRPLQSALAALGDDAPPVYLVGGTVRDLLLGQERFELDVDIAVEGEAIELARKLAGVLAGRVTSHPAF